MQDLGLGVVQGVLLGVVQNCARCVQGLWLGLRLCVGWGLKREYWAGSWIRSLQSLWQGVCSYYQGFGRACIDKYGNCIEKY